jgi:hypothetical protein
MSKETITISKEEVTEKILKAQRTANRVDAIQMNRKNVSFEDKRTKRNRTRAAQKKAAFKDQL